jgi:hypothetical protein
MIEFEQYFFEVIRIFDNVFQKACCIQKLHFANT